MKVKQLLEGIWDQQHHCPSGMVGWLAGEQMVRQHRPETAWTIDLLDIQPADHVLEVGFGAGRGIKLAAEKASDGRVMGIDLSEVMVRVATRRNARVVKAGRVVLSQGNITALPFEDLQFDKIMTIHTFYFWPEPPRTMSELQRVLKPGGRLVITLSTGKINARGEVEVGPLQSVLEEQVVPGMQRGGFKVARLERGPNSRQYISGSRTGMNRSESDYPPGSHFSFRLG
jgi:ubiquinone/menaquinone biosynthesis C-methylase UbiE